MEIKRLEIEREIKIEILKQTEKTVRKEIEEIKKKSELELIELEIKEIIETTTENLEIRINKFESYCSKLLFENIISF